MPNGSQAKRETEDCEQPVVVATYQLTRYYGDGVVVRALDGVDMVVHKGEFLAVMGPSGSGKSTLLNLIGALDRPTSGRVIVNGEDLTTIRDVDRFRACTVGFVFQLHNLLPTLTARENVEVPMHGQRISKSQMRRRAEHLLELVGLADRMNHIPAQLSGGQRQRVAVARALANDPAIILADEPTGSLDTQSGSEIMDLFEHINQTQGTTILVVTHDPRVARRTRRILTMRDGKIVDDHPVQDAVWEDLRDLAHSRLGEMLLKEEDEALLEQLGVTTPDGVAALAILRSWLWKASGGRGETI
ncbi:MAG: ABC transporter ATP-binding protein [Ardenticatenia bacterium]|nr:MAG: ABC transporter ATP-binding protein [Ardenticatenia bacterium]